MDFSKIKITETQDPLEISDIHGLFAQHHELGHCRARYERVYQIVEYRGEWIGESPLLTRMSLVFRISRK